MAVLGTQAKFSLLSSAHAQGVARLPTCKVKVQCAGSRGAIVAALHEQQEEENVAALVSRRGVLAATTSAAGVAVLGDGAALADQTISSWEQVTLPVDPGVVLLDMAFVPDQPDRGAPLFA